MSSLFFCLFHTRYNSQIFRAFYTQFIFPTYESRCQTRIQTNKNSRRVKYESRLVIYGNRSFKVLTPDDSGSIGIAVEWEGSRKLDCRQTLTRKIKDWGPQKTPPPFLMSVATYHFNLLICLIDTKTKRHKIVRKPHFIFRRHITM